MRTSKAVKPCHVLTREEKVLTREEKVLTREEKQWNHVIDFGFRSCAPHFSLRIPSPDGTAVNEPEAVKNL